MIQTRTDLQNDLFRTEQWREELSRNQQYKEAVCQYDKEKLLHREMARLRLKLKLGGGIVKEPENNC